ncbi:clec16a/tt9 domain containing protein [Babesia gibsoni]|uniref:Clec16a/tt9 domain containing protein n=1 Tax=Babesia gibsoni TaxID=33632 RepID=A0AAD8UU18_BABGI|nr:clec16a/tt9 domain containing protein [Babesia gibsoni]
MEGGGGSQRNVEEVGPIYLEQLRVLHIEVMNPSTYSTASAGDVVDALKQLAELMIWGDATNYESIFDYFCEVNLMDFLTSVLPRSPFKVVLIQLLQTISMMIHNVGNEKMRYYMLSNNYLNTLISTPGIYSDGDVSNWAASLLKTLSGLLNSTTIKFFHREGNSAFPLLDEALKLLFGSDSMKCTHAMTIILNIIRVNEPSVTQYLLKKSHILSQLALYLRTCWRRLNKQIKRNNLESIGQTEAILLTTCDDVFQFIQDVMDQSNDAVNKVLLERLFNTCFFPLVMAVTKKMDHVVTLMDAIDVPSEISCNYLRECYQKLLVMNGLTVVYANNKSALFSGNCMESDNDYEAGSQDSAPQSPRSSEWIENTTSLSPRSMKQYLDVNISATLLTTELMPNVSYYLLVTHLVTARRKDIRHYLLLLTQCPIAPRTVLQRLLPIGHSQQSDSDTGEEQRDKTREEDMKNESVYHCMKMWERKIFVNKSFQSSGSDHIGMEDVETKEEYVLNVVMGEVVKVATVELPRKDNRLAMLMACIYHLQTTFVKRVLTPDDLLEHPFETFIAVPSTVQGLHAVLQLMNSVFRYVTTPKLRVQVLNLALSIARKNAEIIMRYNPLELSSFTEELRFHIDLAFNAMKLLIVAEMEKCTSQHISAFYDEWHQFEASPSRQVDILEYPQLLLDATTTVDDVQGSTTSPNKSYHESPTSTPLPSEQEKGEKQGDPIKPLTGNTSHRIEVNGKQPENEPNFRSRLSSWLLGGIFSSSMEHGQSAQYPNTHNPQTDGNRHWMVGGDSVTIFRRHIQVAFLLREISNDVDCGRLNTPREGNGSPSSLLLTYDRCPLYKNQDVKMRGTTLSLGALISVPKEQRFPCTMSARSGLKRRNVVCSDLFFLLVREKPLTPLLEVTSIHPLWNVELNKVDHVKHSCVMAVTLYYEPKPSFELHVNYCRPRKMPAVHDLVLTFENEDNLVEYVNRFKMAKAKRTSISSGILRDYFLNMKM